MKLVREYINEKFVEDSDPIKDMGIGIFAKRSFNTTQEAAKWIVEHIPEILRLEEIPKNIVKLYTVSYDADTQKEKKESSYYHKIKYFIKKYINVEELHGFIYPESHILGIVYQMLEKKGYKRY